MAETKGHSGMYGLRSKTGASTTAGSCSSGGATHTSGALVIIAVADKDGHQTTTLEWLPVEQLTPVKSDPLTSDGATPVLNVALGRSTTAQQTAP